MADRRSAALVDVDGTLVDTAYGHTVAWARALRRGGVDVSSSRLHHLIGMGADQLLNEVVGSSRSDLEDMWAEEFAVFRNEARLLPGARDLLRVLNERGAGVVLATSGQPQDVDHMLDLLDAEAWIDEVVTSEEVEASKPAPDIFQHALDAAGVKADRSIAVGDTVWDVKAAGAADIGCVCVLTGGISRCELIAAGALAVYDDAADLLSQLDSSPLAGLLT